ncbi:MAG TPA: ATP-dependent DNA ligase [Mycobacteriales bacterium]|nr:ATP-dependent DNA ligase [Mycobacteriales bacterium]
MLLADLAAASLAVASTPARSQKVELLAAALRQAEPAEVPVVVAYLSGDLRQRRTGVGWKSLRELPPPAPEPSLEVLDVDGAFESIARCAGAGSQAERARRIGALFERATAPEQRLLAALVSGELRQGALESLVADAAARAAGVPVADLRRAAMLCGALAPAAVAALQDGAAALADFRLEVLRPLQPMLASPATSIDDAFARVCPAAVEWKVDGVRVQVHRLGDVVRVFTRTLDDITDRLPEVVSVVRALDADALVLDGEVVALDASGRPQPFQVTSSRVATHGGAAGEPLTAWFFDLLHRDGEDLLGRPGADRAAALDALLPAALRVPRIVTDDPAAAAAFAADALARGHEGVVVKSLDATYDAGRRGVGWLKVKPRHTLDLVVLAAEWGHGRRHGWLSNLHLGAVDPVSGGHVMLGKTFKGLTDEMLRWQTRRLLDLAETPSAPGGNAGLVVHVRPELVVEVAFDGVQTSPRYPGGVALRFARVLRFREDKTAAEADTIDTVRAIRDASGQPTGSPPT